VTPSRAGRAQFDPLVVDAFIEIAEPARIALQ
jgi:response regulator RpfG family c-di-GMP phosphodiesterase